MVIHRCLQEITYLTSATALNPLPDRTPAGLQRPRKHMIDVPPQLPAQGGSSGSSSQGDSLLPGSIPQPHSSGGNTVIPLPQAAGAAPSAAIGTISQLNVTNATSEASAASVQPDAIGSNPSANIMPNNNTNQAGSLNATAQTPESLPANDLTLPRTAADVFSSIPSNEEGSDAATLNADAAARLTAIFRPESSEEWKKALQKAGQQQQGGKTPSGLEGESVGQTLSMKEAQAQYSQEKEVPAMNGTGARGRSDTVQSTTSASSAAGTNDADNDHKVWKPRRTLRA